MSVSLTEVYSALDERGNQALYDCTLLVGGTTRVVFKAGRAAVDAETALLLRDNPLVNVPGDAIAGLVSLRSPDGEIVQVGEGGAAALRAAGFTDSVESEANTDEPLPGYAEWTPARIRVALASLDEPALDAVEAYEKAHKARRTVLAAIGDRRRQLEAPQAVDEDDTSPD